MWEVSLYICSFMWLSQSFWHRFRRIFVLIANLGKRGRGRVCLLWMHTSTSHRAEILLGYTFFYWIFLGDYAVISSLSYMSHIQFPNYKLVAEGKKINLFSQMQFASSWQWQQAVHLISVCCHRLPIQKSIQELPKSSSYQGIKAVSVYHNCVQAFSAIGSDKAICRELFYSCRSTLQAKGHHRTQPPAPARPPRYSLRLADTQHSLPEISGDNSKQDHQGKVSKIQLFQELFF